MITVATRLGMIACRYLVTGYDENRYISAPEIAQHYNMNVRALMPALRQLTRVGILRSRVGGNMPGFIFSKSPKEFTLFQVLTVLEGSSQFLCCKELVPALNCDCYDKSKCSIFSLFGDVIKDVTKKLSSITMADYAKNIEQELK